MTHALTLFIVQILKWLTMVAIAGTALSLVFVVVGWIELWMHRRRLKKKNLPPVGRGPAKAGNAGQAQAGPAYGGDATRPAVLQRGVIITAELRSVTH